MIRNQIVEKLKAEVPGLRQVEGAAQMRSLEDLRRGAVTLPAAFVIHSGHQAVGNDLYQNDSANGIKVEVIEDRYVITLVCENRFDSHGRDSSDTMDKLVQGVMEALQGWKVNDNDCVTSLSFIRGNIVGLYDDIILWLEEFSYQKMIRHNIRT